MICVGQQKAVNAYPEITGYSLTALLSRCLGYPTGILLVVSSDFQCQLTRSLFNKQKITPLFLGVYLGRSYRSPLQLVAEHPEIGVRSDMKVLDN